MCSTSLKYLIFVFCVLFVFYVLLESEARMCWYCRYFPIISITFIDVWCALIPLSLFTENEDIILEAVDSEDCVHVYITCDNLPISKLGLSGAACTAAGSAG